MGFPWQWEGGAWIAPSLIVSVGLGRGKTILEGLRDRQTVELISTRAFRNGNVLLCCKLAK